MQKKKEKEFANVLLACRPEGEPLPAAHLLPASVFQLSGLCLRVFVCVCVCLGLGLFAFQVWGHGVWGLGFGIQGGGLGRGV